MRDIKGTIYDLPGSQEHIISRACIAAGRDFAAGFGVTGVDIHRLVEGLYQVMVTERNKRVEEIFKPKREIGRRDPKHEVGRLGPFQIPEEMYEKGIPWQPTPTIEFVPENMTEIKEWADARRGCMKQSQTVAGAFQRGDHDIMSLWNCIARIAERLDGIDGAAKRVERNLYGQTEPPAGADGLRKTGTL